MTVTADRPPCWACFKPVARHADKRGPGGKRRRPHKCPHGVACISGTPEGAQGYNGPPLGGKHYCRPCIDAHKAYWRDRESKAEQLRLRLAGLGLRPA